MLSTGIRIVRGPDWTWGDQDGGEGYVGTVCEVGKSGTVGSPDKTVVVQWDNGTRTNYRVGYTNKFDLRVIDNAQAGVKQQNIACDGCNSQGISGMRFKCITCFDYDLCYMCYHGNMHNLNHPFKRFDSATSSGVDLPVRRNAMQGELYGIFEGAKVVRGFNWEWGDQDGGQGKVGKVLDIRGWDNESSRSVANVTWANGSTNVYRLGHKGNCDIKYVEAASGGRYYIEHLPILGHIVEQVQVKPVRLGPVPFSVGDKVQVLVNIEQLREMQQGHGGWNPKMGEFIDKVGTVHRVTDKGDIRVQYEGCNNRWTYNPKSLCKVNSFAVGDIVSVICDEDEVKKLQKGHGEWIEIMKNAIGKLGKVIKLYHDGDLRVQLDGQAWTLNPQCVRVVPGSAAELANTMQATQNQRQEPSMQWQPSNGSERNSIADQLVRAAQGNLGLVVKLLQKISYVDMQSGGKTALQVASHQGQLEIAKVLIQAGADVNCQDSDGDTCLHYAAFGNQAEILKLLINTGANLNTPNKGGCTALHIAAHKKPAKCVQVLLAAGADPNSKDCYGDTALHDAIGKDSFQVIEQLCSASGMDFTLRNKRGFNVLHHAALKGKNFATVKLLAQARQLVDVKKDDGFSALHLASLNGHKDVVETLVKDGHADTDLRNNRNQSALLLAVSQGHSSIIELLVKLKADINAKDEDGLTALHIVLTRMSQVCTEIRQEQSPDIFMILQALPEYVIANRQYIAIACYLIQQDIDLELLNAKGQTALSQLHDSQLQELLKSYKPVVDSNQLLQNIIGDVHTLHLEDGAAAGAIEGYNLPENARSSPSKNVECAKRRSRKTEQNKQEKVGCSSSEGSPSHKSEHSYENETKPKAAECSVCSDYTVQNVTLEPCNHRLACEECSSRIRKCFDCGDTVLRRVTMDGRLIPYKHRQPSAERLRYLETKVAEFEELQACSICMERRRNVVFLCGHGTCSRCADTLKICHMCRKTISKKIPVY
ncbi:PREDICTED: E3 ubiquitin-protein ligase MIB2 [Nicrophorus vespilloides]|uniref:RING-type E3 ubiquitin transferase n=1 Tax=Nicrophorus vespilloides TaxID=110193 RepID=A0ABM1M7U8_NICVS|nr:PREDICTED: E3 ubiquitin-protein ligase MIB2 [Nicrophorus vespilloides]XP_017770648.1 PREDICTED: E3 ubiquitin-protein ligase MIB2 [Nicrophorus vespilloides]